MHAFFAYIGLSLMVSFAPFAAYSQSTGPNPEVPPSAAAPALSDDPAGSEGMVPPPSSLGVQRYASIDWRSSLMFRSEEANNLRMVLEAFDRRSSQGGEESNYLSELLDAAPIPNSIAQLPPRFFLDSIVYYSPSEWTIWVNGKKIEAASVNEKDALQVEHISKNAVRFTWKTPSITTAKSTWQQNHDAPTYNIKSAKGQEVTVDEEKGVVRFTLRPNQTFDTATMQISEGHPAASKVMDELLGQDTGSIPSAPSSAMQEVQDSVPAVAPAAAEPAPATAPVPANPAPVPLP